MQATRGRGRENALDWIYRVAHFGTVDVKWRAARRMAYAIAGL
jgi:hypothetical protein